MRIRLRFRLFQEDKTDNTKRPYPLTLGLRYGVGRSARCQNRQRHRGHPCCQLGFTDAAAVPYTLQSTRAAKVDEWVMGWINIRGGSAVPTVNRRPVRTLAPNSENPSSQWRDDKEIVAENRRLSTVFKTAVPLPFFPPDHPLPVQPVILSRAAPGCFLTPYSGPDSTPPGARTAWASDSL
jgi:hypothetical protein